MTPLFNKVELCLRPDCNTASERFAKEMRIDTQSGIFFQLTITESECDNSNGIARRRVTFKLGTLSGHQPAQAGSCVQCTLYREVVGDGAARVAVLKGTGGNIEVPGQLDFLGKTIYLTDSIE